jgi:hypothetical protein
VGDREDRLVSELPLYHLLDERVSLYVDAGSRLVDQHDPFGAEQGPRDVEQLFLPRTQILSPLGHFRVDALLVCELRPDPAQLQSLNHLLVSVRSCRVDVLPNRPRKHEVVLHDDVHIRPELFETQFADVHAVDLDAPSRGLQDPEQSEHHGALPAACPAHDADLLARTNSEGESFEDVLGVGVVSQAEVFEDDFSFREDLSSEVNLLELFVFSETVVKESSVSLLWLDCC